MPGGTAYYVARAWASLGLSVCVVTRVASADAPGLLADLSGRGVHIRNLGSRRTTVFENRYDGPALQDRTQRVLAIADSIGPADLEGISARAVHVGPLTRGEVHLDIFEHLPGVAPYVALDGQGLLREVVDEQVRLRPFARIGEVLPKLHLLKVDDTEAQVMVGVGPPDHAAGRLAEAGVDEVLMTFADRGSAVLSAGQYHPVAVCPPPETIDATGCGDTYVAAYIYARLKHEAPRQAAHFASAAASLKVGGYGPFVGNETDVRSHMTTAG